MKSKIAKSIIRHYLSLYAKYGDSHKSLGWLNGRQSIRFNILTQIGQFHNSSVLDVGCGFGDFYGYSKYMNLKIKYLGVDINEEFLGIARKRYPDAKFEFRDIQKKQFSKKFDWIVGIGLTNHASTYPHLQSMLKEMFRICKKGVAIDFISSYVDYRDKNIFYTSPLKIFDFAKKLTKRVSLRHDYLPYEFCLYLYKNDKKNQKNVFVEYYNQLHPTLQNDTWIKTNYKKLKNSV